MTDDWVPESCTLPTADRPLRVLEFDQLFADHLRNAARVDPQTLDLTLDASSRAAAADLIARETKCCSFFDFTLSPIPDHVLMPSHVLLRISVPPTQTAVLDALADSLPR
ncbi:hypothetical protein [Kribbella sp. NPDC055071]